MFCPNCGAQNHDGAAFCGNCGASLRDVSDVSASRQAQAFVPQPVQQVRPAASQPAPSFLARLQPGTKTARMAVVICALLVLILLPLEWIYVNPTVMAKMESSGSISYPSAASIPGVRSAVDYAKGAYDALTASATDTTSQNWRTAALAASILLGVIWVAWVASIACVALVGFLTLFPGFGRLDYKKGAIAFGIPAATSAVAIIATFVTDSILFTSSDRAEGFENILLPTFWLWALLVVSGVACIWFIRAKRSTQPRLVRSR